MTDAFWAALSCVKPKPGRFCGMTSFVIAVRLALVALARTATRAPEIGACEQPHTMHLGILRARRRTVDRVDLLEAARFRNDHAVCGRLLSSRRVHCTPEHLPTKRQCLPAAYAINNRELGVVLRLPPNQSHSDKDLTSHGRKFEVLAKCIETGRPRIPRSEMKRVPSVFVRQFSRRCPVGN
jgi:hypothetical protein